MKRTSRIVILVLTLSLLATPAVQAVSDTGVNFPPQFEKLQSLASDSLVRIPFKEVRTVQSLDRTITSDGWILFKPDLGILRVVTEPFRKIRFIGVDGTVARKNRDGRVRRMEADQLGEAGQLFTAFSHILRGDLNRLSNLFNVQFNRSQDQWTLRLTPKTASQSDFFDRITIEGHGSIESVSVDVGEGNVIKTHYGERDTRSRMTDEERAMFEAISVDVR